MAADILSNFIGMTLQATGNNTWGSVPNGSALVPLKRAMRGNMVRSVTGGTLDLSGSPPPATADGGLTDPLKRKTGRAIHILADQIARTGLQESFEHECLPKLLKNRN